MMKKKSSRTGSGASRAGRIIVAAVGAGPAKTGVGHEQDMAEPQGPVPPPTIAKRFRWWGHPVALLRTVLSQDDTPHHIALGAAIGTFVGLTPTPGVQMLLVLAVYYATRRVLKFNLPAGLAATYLSNPLTAAPLAWGSYQIGRLFVDGDLTWDELVALTHYDSFADWWQKTVALVVDLGGAYLIGSVFIAAGAAFLAYPFMLYLLHLVRSRAGGGAGQLSVSPPADAPRPVATREVA